MDLVALQEYTTAVELQPGETLYSDGATSDLERGLFFIEFGVLVRFQLFLLSTLYLVFPPISFDLTFCRLLKKIERDTAATMTRGSLSSLNRGDLRMENGNSLSRVQAWSLGKFSASFLGRNATASFRVARIGPGWVAGTWEAVIGRRRQGEQVAVTHCRLHHLPYSKIVEIEKENPKLILSLYKLLSYLMARRQEATIGQLATLHSIMSSPPQIRPLARSGSSST